jgi:hypothetical protein
MGGSLTEDEFKSLKDHSRYSNLRNFVETGTYKADTTMQAAEKFDFVYTTEIVPVLYENSKRIASRFDNISFYLGDSVELLQTIMPQVSDGAVFFLDAHQSGHDTGNNKKQLVPLIEEINTILSFDLGPSVFILDDLRLWKGQEKAAWGWDQISTLGILKLFVKHGKTIVDFYEKNDRFWIYLE